jgi:nucleotide-binding universal stress UspA family protein
MLGEEPDPRQSVAGHLARAPIVVAAIDLAQRSEALNEAMRSNLRDILRAAPAARLACVMVLKTSRIGMDVTEDEEGRNLHVKGLVDLNHWARPLGLPPNRITYHVLEAPDAGAAIVEFAESNHVAQVVVGSRGSSTLRRYLGSVSSQVVALANCTVTVVKTDDRSELAES